MAPKVSVKRKAVNQRAVGRKKKLKRKSTKSKSIGQHFARASRAVLAQLPGSALTTPIADFVFSVFGITETNIDLKGSSKTNIVATVFATGLYGAFLVYPRMFMADDSKSGLVFPPEYGSSKHPSHNPMVRCVTTQFGGARFAKLSVRARNTGPAGRVSGSWGIGFTPFRLATDHDIFVTGLNNASPFEYLQSMSKSSVGKVKQPLNIDHKFVFGDGISAQPNSLDHPIGIVVVAYEDIMRSSGSMFSTDDFQCEIDTSASLEFVSRTAWDQYILYTESSNPLKVSAIVSAPNGRFAFDSTTKITSSEGRIKLSGGCENLRALPSPPAMYSSTLVSSRLGEAMQH